MGGVWREYDCYAVFELSGTLTFEDTVHQISDALRQARERKYQKLLCDIREVNGFDAPDVAQRYWFASEFSKAALGKVKFALLVRPELIDYEKFGVTASRNRNLVADVFPSAPEALVWLLVDDAG